METKQIDLSKRLFVVIVILTIGLLTSWGLSSWSLFKSSQGDYPREFSVSGEGKAIALPDIAVINLGVRTENIKSEVVVQENTQKMNAILQAVKELGIEERDIQTVNYSFNPEYNYWEGRRTLRAYVLTQEIRVKIRDFAKIGEVLESSSSKGANIIGSLSFEVEDLEAVKQLARAQAIEKAKEKAQAIAKQAGIKLGKVINIYESYYGPYYDRVDGYGSSKEIAPIAAAVPQIQPGEMEITSTINIVFKIK
jgi:uncharacterized protein